MNGFIIGVFVAIVAIDAAYITPGVWGEYGSCSKSCGGGVMEKDKMCGTYICGKMQSTCNSFPCGDPLMTADWTPCDSTCKGECQAKDTSGNVLATIECNGQCELAMPTCNKKVLFVVDRTGSIEFLNFVREKQFVKDLLTTFQESVDVGLIAFSGNAITYQNFGSSNTVQQTKDQIDAMVYDGAATATVPALEAALDVVMEETGAVVVLMADSGTNSENGYDSGVISVADQIKQHAKIIAIQMSTIANQELAAIAPENIVQVDSPSGLSDVISDVANRICD